MMINKKQQQFITTLIYMIILQKNVSMWLELSQKHDVSMHLIRKLIMICFDKTVSNHNQLILQVIESINKMKNSFITSKIIATKQLFSENVLIITNTAMIKKKLKYDSVWFLIINQAMKINYKKFTIIMHEMHMIMLNCSKQKMMIQQFLNQNMHFKNHIKILSTY